MNLTPNVDNIVNTYKIASESEHEEGSSWYSLAHNLCHTLRDIHRAETGKETSTWQWCATLALLSINRPWPDTIRQASNLAIGNPVHTFKWLKKRLQQIFDSTFEDLSLLGHGNKVIAFYHNIKEPLHTLEAVIDRHAIAVAIGRQPTASEIAWVQRSTVRVRAFQAVYLAASELLSDNGDGEPYRHIVLPNQVQAVTWVYWRNHHEFERA